MYLYAENGKSMRESRSCVMQRNTVTFCYFVSFTSMPDWTQKCETDRQVKIEALKSMATLFYLSRKPRDV